MSELLLYSIELFVEKEYKEVDVHNHTGVFEL